MTVTASAIAKLALALGIGYASVPSEAEVRTFLDKQEQQVHHVYRTLRRRESEADLDGDGLPGFDGRALTPECLRPPQLSAQP